MISSKSNKAMRYLKLFEDLNSDGYELLGSSRELHDKFSDWEKPLPFSKSEKSQIESLIRNHVFKGFKFRNSNFGGFIKGLVRNRIKGDHFSSQVVYYYYQDNKIVYQLNNYDNADFKKWIPSFNESQITNFAIHKEKDNYYIVQLSKQRITPNSWNNNQITYEYYKCDDIYGVKNLIDDKS